MKPILFNTAMVKTILDGRKAQTRRAIKNIDDHEYLAELDGSYKFACVTSTSCGKTHDHIEWREPKYQPGDIQRKRDNPHLDHSYKLIYENMFLDIHGRLAKAGIPVCKIDLTN